MNSKRRLPVLKDAPPPATPGTPGDGEHDDDGEARPPWHWVGFGTVAVFGAWLPLSWIAELVRRRATAAWIGLPESREETARAIAALTPAERAKLGLVFTMTHGLALGLAAFAGGALVGRYGGDRIGPREAALAGIMAALIATALSWQGISWVPLFTFAIATFGAWLGGRSGVKRRKKAGI